MEGIQSALDPSDPSGAALSLSAEFEWWRKKRDARWWRRALEVRKWALQTWASKCGGPESCYYGAYMMIGDRGHVYIPQSDQNVIFKLIENNRNSERLLDGRYTNGQNVVIGVDKIPCVKMTVKDHDEAVKMTCYHLFDEPR